MPGPLPPALASAAPRTGNVLRVLLLVATALVPFLDAVFAASQTPVSRTPRKVALLVGVGTFKHTTKLPDLRGVPQRDVDALEVVLKGRGFEVVKLTDERATKKDVEARYRAALDGGGDSSKSLGDGDLLLTVLCTHGFTLEVADPTTKAKSKEPFLAGYDAVPDEPASLIGLNGLIEAGKTFGAAKLFLVDACRELPHDQNRGQVHGVEGRQMSLPERTAVLFACGRGQLSHQSEKAGGGHGLFTFAVLKTLRGGGRVSWTGLVHDVEQTFDSDEWKAYLPKGRAQVPVETKGELGATELFAEPAAGDVVLSPDAGTVFTSKTTNMPFVRIKAGKFVMGSQNDDRDRGGDEDSHEVTLTKDYCLGKFEVTRGQFKRFVDAAGYKTEGEGQQPGGYGWDAGRRDFVQDPKYTWRNPGFEQTDDHPVVLVSWNDAVAFCKWLSRADGRTYRLPTEAEWEFACRAGSTSRFHFGENDEGLAKHANGPDGAFRKATGLPHGIGASDGYAFTAPVGKFRENPFHLCDMHGNVWEWCEDYHGSNKSLSGWVDPVQRTRQSEAGRVLRGGSWGFFAKDCRSATRNKAWPEIRSCSVGFRVCFRPD